jgi:excisionase family DNA binding protein
MDCVNLLNQNQAADLLGVSPHRITKWLDRGLIPYVQIGRVRKIDREALLEWYRSQMVFPNQESDPENEDSVGGANG